jgi:hypothetical protein
MNQREDNIKLESVVYPASVLTVPVVPGGSCAVQVSVPDDATRSPLAGS